MTTMDDAVWIWVAVAVGSGLLFGEIAGRLVRTALAGGRAGRAAAELSGQLGNVVFWASTAAGLVVGIAIADRGVLEDLSQRLASSLPRFMVGVLLAVGGWAVATVVAAMVGQSARRATGVRQVALERLLRATIMAAAVVVALTEMGVAPSILTVLVAIALGAPALAITLLAVRGGGAVARQIAAGRVLRGRLRPGQRIAVPTVAGRAVDGVVVALHPTSVEVEEGDGERVHVPNLDLVERLHRADP